jgi:siroheme synthase
MSAKTTPPALFRLGRLLRASSALPAGVVSLVGAGPGDPGLLTIKAARRIGEADVIYHDALVSDAILKLCRPGVRLVAVGKRRGKITMPQEAIVDALAREARRGLAVVRLKGGDPFVFGRGGEESPGLARARRALRDRPRRVLRRRRPRGRGYSCHPSGHVELRRIVTAHDVADPAVRTRLSHLAQGADTLVIFMAGTELHGVEAALIDAGLPRATEAAIIESGTRAEERILRGTLDGLGALLPASASGPLLVVLGPTVALGDALRAARRKQAAASRPTAGARSHV